MNSNILLLVTATMIWGLGFVATRLTLSDYTPLWSNSLRYIFAGILSTLLIFFYRKGEGKISHKNVFVCSLLLFLGMLLQTIGISGTTMAKSGFLTVLYAVFTPLFLCFRGVHLSFKYWCCVGLAMIGVAMMCEFKVSGLNTGDLFIIASAVFFSLHIICVDRFAKNWPSFLFNLWQCVHMGIIGIVTTTFLEPVPSLTPLLTNYRFDGPLVGFIFLVVFSSIIAFGIQIKVQEKLRPHIVSAIFLMESVFASVFGHLFFQETLSILASFGASFILLSVFIISRLSKEARP